MPFSNYIYEYYDGITTGKIVVGKWVRLIYEYIVSGLQNGLFLFNAKKANKAIRFIENFCHHCEGRTDLLKLELWQKAAVSLIFGIVDEDNVRIFREVFIVIGRKNGKTLFASAVIAYMAYLDGEYGAKIYCLAPKLEQANIVYDNFFQMIKKEPELSELAKKRRSDIYIEESNTAIKPLAFNAKKSRRRRLEAIRSNEIRAWRTPPAADPVYQYGGIRKRRYFRRIDGAIYGVSERRKQRTPPSSPALYDRRRGEMERP